LKAARTGGFTIYSIFFALLKTIPYIEFFPVSGAAAEASAITTYSMIKEKFSMAILYHKRNDW